MDLKTILDKQFNPLDSIKTEIENIENALINLTKKTTAIEDTRKNLEFLSEHPRNNGILHIDSRFYMPGQVQASGEVFITCGDYKIGVTPKQALVHLDNDLVRLLGEKKLLQQEKDNNVEKLQVALEFSSAEPQEEVVFGNMTGKVFKRGEFYEIVECETTEQSVDSKFGNLSISKSKRVARVKNEAEKLEFIERKTKEKC